MSITKVRSRKVENILNYTTVEYLIDELHTFEKQMGWPIFEILSVLKQKKADSFSITKEKPFYYFYARLSKKTVIIRLQNSEQEIEFRLPVEKLEE